MPRTAGSPRTAILGLAAALASVGCASERHLVVLSDPPGATVRLDNEVLGVTPLDHRFEYFGGRGLTLYLEGYQPEVRTIDIEPPWYATFPMDLFTELFIGYRFVHTERVALVPDAGLVSEPDLEEVLERAEALRRGSLTGPRPDRVVPAAPPPGVGPPPEPPLPEPAPAAGEAGP